MFLDLLKTDNYISFNKRLAHIIGLKESIYVSQIINIMDKAQKKNKLYDNDFIKLDRNYMYEQTTLTIEEQLKIDEKLMAINLIIRDFDNPDLLKVDIELVISIVSTNDFKAIEKISNKVSANKRVDKKTKMHYVAQNLYRYVNTGNDDLNKAMYKWIDAILDTKGAVLNSVSINLFITELNQYTRGNLPLALKLVEIGTAFNYRDFTWVAKRYEQDNKTNKVPQGQSTTLSNKIY